MKNKDGKGLHLCKHSLSLTSYQTQKKQNMPNYTNTRGFSRTKPRKNPPNFLNYEHKVRRFST